MPSRQTYLQQLAKALVANAWTITCAESCTGGGLAFAFTSLPGSSAWFERGWVTYSNGAKHYCLGVDQAILNQYGAVSEQTVKAMAKGAQRESNAQVAVSVSGIAGPDGGTPDKPVGLVWFGFVFNQTCFAIEQRFSGDRSSVREQAIDFALQKLVEGLVASDPL